MYGVGHLVLARHHDDAALRRCPLAARPLPSDGDAGRHVDRERRLRDAGMAAYDRELAQRDAPRPQPGDLLRRHVANAERPPEIRVRRFR